ncbi:hypothetical protein HU200_049631 [Digitaria exilis]|uniref:Integrase catalytic domain-containing protein n=1 Tax=Digitaria exilis TaxID=1010633 RepID=A0A835E6R1_9POAL|nr:hypothetical protein HU200_049631 [Digitaria exilis]
MDTFVATFAVRRELLHDSQNQQLASEPRCAMASLPPKRSGATPPPEKKTDQAGGSGGTDGKKKTGRKSPRRRVSRSPSVPGRHRDTNQPRERVVERVVRDSGSSGTWPQLTKTNYNEWSLRMKLKLQARDLWDVVEFGDGDYRDDRTALDAICSAVPSEMISTLAVKDTAAEAWEAIKTLRIGDARRRAVTAQTLCTQYENIKLRDGEAIEDFALRFSGTVQRLAELGDPEPHGKAVKKYLRVVRLRYKQLLSIEEITGTLKSSDDAEEEPTPPTGSSTGKLLLTHEERRTWRLQLRRPRKGARSWKGARARRRKRPQRLDSNTGRRRRRVQALRQNWPLGPAQETTHVAQEEEHAEQVEGIFPQIEPPPLQPTSSPPPAASTVELHLLEDKVFAAFDDPGDRDPKRWVLDSGASNHMTGSRAAFSNIDAGVTGSVRFGDGSVARIEGIGTVLLSCKSREHHALNHVYYLPRLTANILSIGQFDEIGYQVLVEDGVMKIRDEERHLLAKINRDAGRLYVLDVDIAQPVCLAVRGEEEAWIWHARFGHLHFAVLRKMGREGLVRGLPLLSQVEQVCEACLAGKHRQAPFPRQAQGRSTEVLQLLHGDICGPISPPTPSGNRYFLLLVDDYSRYMWISLLPTKNAAADAIKHIQAATERKSGKKVMALRTDRGGEFAAADFVKYCAELGVQRQLTAAYSPQQNGVVERRNQTVVGTARSMMKAKDLPGVFWGEAVTTAVYLLNRSSSKSTGGKTPYELWTGCTPGVQHLRTFGCVAHVKTTTPHLKKLDDRSLRMIFVGYEPGSMAYRAYDPATGRVHISRDVVFDESAQWSWPDGDDGGEQDFTIDGLPESTPEVIITMTSTTAHPGAASPAASTPVSTPGHASRGATPAALATPAAQGTPVFATPLSVVDTEQLDINHDVDAPLRYRYIDDILQSAPVPMPLDEVALIASAEEPSSFAEAAHDPAWLKAMKEEIDSIVENKTWTLVDLPPGHRAIGLKWVYKVKRDEHGNVVRHKACLVAKGYVQHQGVDFDEVFALLMLAVAAHFGWEVHHMDVKSAFLNGELKEEAYVAQPPGYIDAKHPGKVLRLHKALYGLRQAPRAWNAKLDATLLSLGFRRSDSEHGVYTRGEKQRRLIVGVYVDDLIITGGDNTELQVFKGEMKKRFRMSDLGILSYYLGIEVNQDSSGISISQERYARKILEKAGLEGCNSCATPMETRLKLMKASSTTPTDATTYRNCGKPCAWVDMPRIASHDPGVMSVGMDTFVAKFAVRRELLHDFSCPKCSRSVVLSTRDPVITLVSPPASPKPTVPRQTTYYMENGSLDNKYQHDGRMPTLPWHNRYRVIKGVAATLLYLHEDWEQVVIHRDVKPSNMSVTVSHLGCRTEPASRQRFMQSLALDLPNAMSISGACVSALGFVNAVVVHRNENGKDTGSAGSMAPGLAFTMSESAVPWHRRRYKTTRLSASIFTHRDGASHATRRPIRTRRSSVYVSYTVTPLYAGTPIHNARDAATHFADRARNTQRAPRDTDTAVANKLANETAMYVNAHRTSRAWISTTPETPRDKHGFNYAPLALVARRARGGVPTHPQLWGAKGAGSAVGGKRARTRNRRPRLTAATGVTVSTVNPVSLYAEGGSLRHRLRGIPSCCGGGATGDDIRAHNRIPPPLPPHRQNLRARGPECPHRHPMPQAPRAAPATADDRH